MLIFGPKTPFSVELNGLFSSRALELLTPVLTNVLTGRSNQNLNAPQSHPRNASLQL